MSTTLMPELSIASIVAHPKNPRHNAVADEDMVASVRENGLIQPIVVAPHPDKAGKYVPIAGHRRVDAAKKAKLKTIPAVLRTDLVTEGQQIEAMIIENGHRLDLTPIEEAEGYAQLELLGYKPAQIAVAVGRNITTVRSRLKLLKLSASTQQRLHRGQLTIEHAAAIGEFSDPDIIEKLERTATAGRNLDYEISNARQLVERRKHNAEQVAALLEAGATEYTLPEGKTLWQLTSGGTLKTLHSHPGDHTFTSVIKAHAGCLRFHQDGPSSNWPTVTVLCDNPSSHVEEHSDDGPQREWEIEREKERAERDARVAAQDAAREARIASVLRVLDTAGKITLPPTVRDLLRVLLPQTLVRNEPAGTVNTYQKVLALHEDDRWDEDWWSPTPVALMQFSQHVDEVATWSDAQLLRGLVAVLTADAEYQIGDTTYDLSAAEYPMVRVLVRNYLALLTESGHVPTPVDEDIAAALDAADQADDGDDTAEAS